MEEALQLIVQLADSRHPDALFTLGDCYWRGAGVSTDLARARDLFEAASEAGQPMAIRAWTNLLSSGIGGARKWPEALVRLGLKRAAMASEPGCSTSFERWNSTQMAIRPAARPSGRAIGRTLGCPRRIHRRGMRFLILLAEPTYERSLVIMDGRDVPDPIRTSDGSTIHWLIEDPATHAINRRIAALSATSVEQGSRFTFCAIAPGSNIIPIMTGFPHRTGV
jgi:prolyl 4-hydroxylase